METLIRIENLRTPPCTCVEREPLLLAFFLSFMGSAGGGPKGGGNFPSCHSVRVGRTPRGSCFLEGFLGAFLEGSLREVLLRRVLRRHLVRVSVGTGVLRRGGGVATGASLVGASGGGLDGATT